MTENESRGAMRIKGIQIKVSMKKMEGIYMMHISEGEGTRRCKEVKEREKDQGLSRGSRVNALFELCKIAAWERGGVCVSECDRRG